jgi:site-specific DNA recombinase
MTQKSKYRCAVYTRKSSEEGLDQAFNSLDAQREACVAYITSQASLGWKLVPDAYDDGGISGGTLERPGIQRLLDHIREDKVDVVVVYKIDRLTRSLMDFAKLVEVFDRHSVSFVSVTQQFNTTTSMGRLTLNVLLSFAQFEREVTAERIRDKIAASKQKGIWMGGRIPLGYRVEDRKLVVDDKGAAKVRYLFDRFLQLRSVSALAREIHNAECNMGPSEWMPSQMPNSVDTLATEVVTPEASETQAVKQVSAPADAASKKSQAALAAHAALPTASQSISRPPAAKPMSQGRLRHLLSNPLYIGKLRHKDKVHDGEHQGIIEPLIFEGVQSVLANKAPEQRRQSGISDVHLLVGLVFDETGDRLRPTHARNHGRRYRYYISHRLRADAACNKDGWRIPAHELERIVLKQAHDLLRDQSTLSQWLEQQVETDQIEQGLAAAAQMADTFNDDANTAPRKRMLQLLFKSITLSPTGIRYVINHTELAKALAPANNQDKGDLHPEADHDHDHDRDHDDSDHKDFIIDRPMTIARRGQEARIVINGSSIRSPETSLIDLIARAHLYLNHLTDGSASSINDLADGLNVHRADISRILPLAFLSPSITDAILTGRQPADLTVRSLSRLIDIPPAWADQAKVFGL